MSKALTLAELQTVFAPLMAQYAEDRKKDKELYDLVFGISQKMDALMRDMHNTKPTETKAAPKTKPKKVEEEKKVAPKKKPVKAKTEDEPQDGEDERSIAVNLSDSDDEKEPKRILNKLDFFNLKFDTEPSFFDNFITDKVKDEVNKANAKEWEKLADNAAKLKVAKRKAFYTWMTKNCDKVLQDLKKNYNDEITKQSVVIATKEAETD